jgi:hydrogenase expression/formation protein HypC
MPGRVVRIDRHESHSVAVVDFGGTAREIDLAFVPDVLPGDFVIAHAGIAIQRLDEAAAAESLALFAELGRTPGWVERRSTHDGPAMTDQP